IAGPRRLGSGLAEAGDGAVDEPRVQAGERLVAEAEALHGAGAEVLEQHVALADQLFQDGPALGRFQIEREALLVAIDRQEVRRFAADERRPRARVVALAGL